MIAKEIQRKTAGSSYRKLIQYLIRAESEKPLMAHLSNCFDLPPHSAIKTIEAMQHLARAKSDKTYHFILSFHPEDHLSKDHLRYIEESFCTMLGYAEHSRISVFHQDTQHPHLHVAINKVHPQTLNTITPYYSQKKMMKLCEQLEIKLNLKHDNHQKTKTSLSQSAQHMEAYSSRKSFERYLLEEVQPYLNLTSCRHWQDLHQELSRFGLMLKPFKRGLVIACSSAQVFIKASALDSSLSLHQLNKRFGEYDDFTAPPLEESKHYQPVEESDLWREYTTIRNKTLKHRAQAREQLSAQQGQRWQQHQEKYAELRAQIRNEKLLSKYEKFKLYQKLAQARQNDCHSIKAQNAHERRVLCAAQALPTWQSFLVDRAIQGDQQALHKLKFACRRGMDRVKQALAKYSETERARLRDVVKKPQERQTSLREQTLHTWIAERNQWLGTVQDAVEHRLIGRETGQFIYRGGREIAPDQFVALLERDNTIFVKSISRGQQRFLRTLARGSEIRLDERGQFIVLQASRSRGRS